MDIATPKTLAQEIDGMIEFLKARIVEASIEAGSMTALSTQLGHAHNYIHLVLKSGSLFRMQRAYTKIYKEGLI
jgi:hypothetical protein